MEANRWSEKRAWSWYDGRPWLCGVNYIPSYAVNFTEMWQLEAFDPELISEELKLAHKIGLKTIRTNFQYLVWQNDPESMKSRIDRFLEIADSHSLTTIFCFFDDCAFGDPARTDPYMGKQQDPIQGLCASSFTPSPGHKAVTDLTIWPDLERYVKDIISYFRSDQRVLMWDIYNEPGNMGIGSKNLPLLETSFGWARAANPEQPISSGVWTYGYEDDREREIPEISEIQEFCLKNSDIITFHFYGDYESMKRLIEQLKEHKRPVICTEWMTRLTNGSYEKELPLFREEQVGCLSWGLVNGRSQTQFHWNSPRGVPEPEVWFVDLFRKDHTPYDPKEIEVILENTTAADRADHA
jgi:hypothetical protein